MTETTSPAYAGLAVAELIQSGHGADDAIERAPGVYESRGIGNSYLRWPTFASCCRPKRRPYLPWNVNASSGNAAPPTSSARSGSRRSVVRTSDLARAQIGGEPYYCFNANLPGAEICMAWPAARPQVYF